MDFVSQRMGDILSNQIAAIAYHIKTCFACSKDPFYNPLWYYSPLTRLPSLGSTFCQLAEQGEGNSLNIETILGAATS